jgi:thiol-disulfide isomerase/thioredoxin
MKTDYKKKYLKYKLKYLYAKNNYSKHKTNNKFYGGSTIENKFDDLLANNKFTSVDLKTYLEDSNKKDILLIVYAHWCSHCVSFISESGVKLINSEQALNIKFIDGTQISTELKNQLEIMGFPTILKIDKSSNLDKVIKKEYVGDRSVSSLINFLIK